MHCMNTTKNFVPLHNDSKHVKSLLHLVTSSLCCEISLNKNAFQYDAYHPLQWSSPLRVSAQGGVCPGGVCPGGVCPEGVCQTPPLWTQSQTGVKTLPCRNYVADRNKYELASPVTWLTECGQCMRLLTPVIILARYQLTHTLFIESPRRLTFQQTCKMNQDFTRDVGTSIR